MECTCAAASIKYRTNNSKHSERVRFLHVDMLFTDFLYEKHVFLTEGLHHVQPYCYFLRPSHSPVLTPFVAEIWSKPFFRSVGFERNKQNKALRWSRRYVIPTHTNIPPTRKSNTPTYRKNVTGFGGFSFSPHAHPSPGKYGGSKIPDAKNRRKKLGPRFSKPHIFGFRP